MRSPALTPTLALCIAGCSLLTSTDNLSGSAPQPVSSSDAGPALDAAVLETSVGADAVDAPKPSYGDIVLADQPKHYFPFDEPAGSSLVRDRVGGAVAEIIDNVDLGVPAVGGTTGLEFTKRGVLDAGDIFDLAGKKPFTIELWSKFGPCPCTGADLLNKRNNAVDPLSGWIVYLDDQQSVHFELWGKNVSRSAWGLTNTSELTHVVFTYDGVDDMRLYLDTKRVSTAFDGSGDGPDEAVHLFIGQKTFQGVIDELALYEHALSPERVAAHYEAGRR